MILNELDSTHELRNIPLAGCFYLWKHSKVWMEIKPSFGISKKTFNNLGQSWVGNDLFSFSKGE